MSTFSVKGVLTAKHALEAGPKSGFPKTRGTFLGVPLFREIAILFPKNKSPYMGGWQNYGPFWLSKLWSLLGSLV